MHLLLELAHFDVDDFIGLARGMNHWRYRQRIDVAGEFDAASNLSGRGHHLSKGRYALVQGESQCGIETTPQQSPPAQHASKSRLTSVVEGGT